jgi:hypothetical protein
MKAGVDHQPRATPQFEREHAELGIEVAIETKLLTQPFGVERPTST